MCKQTSLPSAHLRAATRLESLSVASLLLNGCKSFIWLEQGTQVSQTAACWNVYGTETAALCRTSLFKVTVTRLHSSGPGSAMKLLVNIALS
jgi:hypothetical protein